jgi:hypothetical protein
MKKQFLTLAVALVATVASAQYQVVTVIESILPGGVGRSRMIESTSTLDYNAFTASNRT